MRILVTIPHFYQPKPNAFYGSERADASVRVTSLMACLLSLHQRFGRTQSHMGQIDRECNKQIAADLDVVICTAGDAHLTSKLPPGLFRHHSTQADPRLLGYECHVVLAEALGNYDYYCFMEDDLAIEDELFFWKLAWFTEALGRDMVLQPNRFELAMNPPVRKLYIDSDLADPTISPKFQDRSIQPLAKGRVLGRDVAFERVDNPHSGCFFLSQAQMRLWSEQPYWLDRAEDFGGPLESAATLGLMRTFRVYEPALANAGFFEIRHLDPRYLGRRVQFRPEFKLGSSL